MKDFLLRFLKSGDVWVLSAKWFTPVATLAAGLVTARFLEPEQLGVVQSVMLISVYGSFLHFGVFSGLNRNLPLALAKGTPEQAQRFVDASEWTARTVGLAGAVLAAVASLIFFIRAESPLYFQVCLFLIPGMYFAPRRLHFDTLFRGSRSFRGLGISMHIQNMFNLIAGVLTAFFGIYAAALRTTCMPLFGLLYLKKNLPMSATARASRFSDVRLLSRVGLPMLISGLIFTWLNAADRTIIATFLTSEDLGYFALATITMNSMKAICEPVNQLLYPRVAYCLGEKGSSRHLRRYIWLGLGLNVALLVPIVGLGWFLLPVVVRIGLPEYVPGIDAARLSLLSSLSFIYSGPSVIIPILRRNLPYQVAGVLTLGTVWAGGIWAVIHGYGIEGVTIARAVAMSVFGLFVIGYVFYLTWLDIPCEKIAED